MAVPRIILLNGPATHFCGLDAKGTYELAITAMVSVLDQAAKA